LWQFCHSSHRKSTSQVCVFVASHYLEHRPQAIWAQTRKDKTRRDEVSKKPQYVVVHSNYDLNISWRFNYACEAVGCQHPKERQFGEKSREFEEVQEIKPTAKPFRIMGYLPIWLAGSLTMTSSL
jgi:hypothetical protein